MEVRYAVGRGLREVHWQQHCADGWDEFVDWLKLEEPAGRKECGGYVAGLLQETVGHQGKPKCVGLHRNQRAVVERDVLTFDADSAGPGFSADVRLELDCALAMHTTWSHTMASPRWRLLIPLDRSVTPGEYRTLVATVMKVLGEDQFDKGSKEPERFMHRPSRQEGGVYEWCVEQGEPLAVDEWLLMGEELGVMEVVVPERKFYIDNSEKRAAEDGLHPAAEECLQAEAEKLEVLSGEAWATGAGWDLAVFKAACVVWELVNSGWTGLDEEAGLAWLLDHAPRDDVWGEPEHREKWESAKVRVAGGGVPEPTEAEDDFAAVLVWPEFPAKYSDLYLAAWMGYKGLDGDWCWNGGLGWMQWRGKRWQGRTEEACVEAVRRAVLRLHRRALKSGDGDLVKNVSGLLTGAKVKSVVSLMRGVLERDVEDFDRDHDLLNCGNGVVDLRTGELREHDRGLLMTRITPVDYVADAKDPDWEQVLDCLDEEVMAWMQVRFGQAATGWPTPDDVLPVGQGGGANGKSTLLAGLFAALGDYMVLVPEKLLRSYPGDHPTEMMTLLGARVAVIDETPETAQLSVPKLKAMLGQSRMTARAVYKNNVSWSPTHSLFVMSNYVPQVRETDHGTWRRLALVRYVKKYRRDDAFRMRVAGSQSVREAALRWVIDGSRKWYEAGRLMPEMPEQVRKDTWEWRAETDFVMAFIEEYLEPDYEACVLTTELHAVFNAWLKSRGNQPWSDATLVSRLGGHEEVMKLKIEKKQVRSPAGLSLRDPFTEVPGRPWIWQGLRWRRTE